jgi:hypothetical protein
MKTTDELTFKQPFLDNIDAALNDAVSITFDGCHKIYIALDTKSHDGFVRYDYDMILVDDKTDAMDLLLQWWNVSCGLRFISAVANDDTFHRLIPQSEYDNQQENTDERM